MMRLGLILPRDVNRFFVGKAFEMPSDDILDARQRFGRIGFNTDMERFRVGLHLAVTEAKIDATLMVIVLSGNLNLEVTTEPFEIFSGCGRWNIGFGYHGLLVISLLVFTTMP